MASDMCVRRLTKELKTLQKDPITNPKITVNVHESNILELHYVMEPTHPPYSGGVYHGKLVFPKSYPLKPPSVIMNTPNGRFEPGRRLCLSMSDFHPESWNPMWSISTILTGLYSFMIENKATLGSIETSLAKKQRLAQASLQYNVVNSKDFCKLFPEYVTRYEEEFKNRPNDASDAASSLAVDDVSTQLPRNVMAAVAWVIAVLSILVAVRFV